jgi:hypothetical protein
MSVAQSFFAHEVPSSCLFREVGGDFPYITQIMKKLIPYWSSTACSGTTYILHVLPAYSGF